MRKSKTMSDALSDTADTVKNHVQTVSNGHGVGTWTRCPYTDIGTVSVSKDSEEGEGGVNANRGHAPTPYWPPSTFTFFAPQGPRTRSVSVGKKKKNTPVRFDS